MIHHIDQRPIAECLIRLFILENYSGDDNTFVDVRLSKLQEVVNIFKAEEVNSEKAINAAFVLTELIARKALIQNAAKIQEFYNTKDFLDVLFNNLFKNKFCTSNLTSILISALQLQLSYQEPDSEELDGETTTNSIEDNLIFEYLAGVIGDINDYLQEDTSNSYETTYGRTTAPFGTARLKLVEVLYYAIKLNVHKVCNELGLKNIYKTLMVRDWR